MKPIRNIILFLIVTGMQMPSAFAQAKLATDTRVRVYLKKFREDHVKSLLTKNPELLRKYYADSVRLMPPFQKTAIGKSQATAFYSAFNTRFTVRDYTRTELEILDLHGQILETGTFSIHVIMNKTGKEQILPGKYINLWIEPANGELRLLTEIWNYDQFYGEFHDQLRFDEVPGIYAALLPNVPITNSISFELAALNRLLDQTVTEHDADTWSLYYSDDAILLASYYPICQGKKAVDDYLNTHVKELPIFEELDIRNDRIDNLGTFVIEYASHIASWKNGKRSGVGLGKNIRIWRRDSDQSLKLFRSIGTYD
jgi:ketosteroid isomerase-like protein